MVEKEIPFGAFDSELMHQEISIPEGFTATIEGNKIILTRTENEDERISKEIIKYLEQTVPHNHRDEVLKSKEWIAWLEKQGTPSKLSEEEQNRFAKGVLTSSAMSFIDYLDAHKYEGKMCVSNGECEDIENAFHNAMWDRLHRYYCKYIEKQGTSYTKRDVDDAFVEGMAFAKDELEKQGEQKETLCDKCKKAQPSHSCQDITALGRCYIENINTSNKVEPKFKVKYAGSEYNVFETKEIAGVTFYGIEDEPNHIDYVKAENCEIISVYAIKENGSPYPTKPAAFSEQKPAWSKEDEKILKDILVDVKFEGYNNDMLANSYKKINWLKSLKEKFKIQTRQGISKEDEYSFMLISGSIRQDQDLSLEDKNKLRLWLKSIIYQSRWKPSDEQIKALHDLNLNGNISYAGQGQVLIGLYNDLKKLT